MFKVYLYYLVCINIISFLLYGIDKVKAIRKVNRIRESVLLNFSIFGGCFLGFIGMHLFHHKTKKKQFVIINIVSIIIHSFLIYYIYKYM